MGLIQFMNARLDEDETAANGLFFACRMPGPLRFVPGYGGPAADAFIARHDPGRMLREVAAKRARLALMSEAIDEMDKLIADDDAGRPDQAMAIGRARAAIVAVKHDATVYSDHPDYEQKWAP